MIERVVEAPGRDCPLIADPRAAPPALASVAASGRCPVVSTASDFVTSPASDSVTAALGHAATDGPPADARDRFVSGETEAWAGPPRRT